MLTASDYSPCIVIARSGRFIAESLYRTGIETVVIDQFGDLDTQIYAYDVHVIDELISDLIIPIIDSLNLSNQPAVIYASGVDNNLDLLQQLESRYRLFGNQSHIVKAVREPHLFFDLLDDLDIVYPAVSFEGPLGNKCLVKHHHCEGGLGVVPASLYENDNLTSDCYFQERLDGLPFSVLFLANGVYSRIVGLNSQWFVDDGNQHPYVFQGVISGFELSDSQMRLIHLWLEQIVKATGLKGLNSLDCLLVEDEIVVLEINPRPSKSVSLYDDNYRSGLLKMHICSFVGESWDEQLEKQWVTGHWLCYAPCQFIVREGIDWPNWVADQPHAGHAFNQGDPVCTVKTTGMKQSEVRNSLLQRCHLITKLLLGQGC